MTENRLNIIKEASDSPNSRVSSDSPVSSNFSDSSNSSYQNTRNARSKVLQAKFERLWLVDPEQFNPMRNCIERERIERTWQLLNKHVSFPGQSAVDIGCAAG